MNLYTYCAGVMDRGCIARLSYRTWKCGGKTKKLYKRRYALPVLRVTSTKAPSVLKTLTKLGGKVYTYKAWPGQITKSGYVSYWSMSSRKDVLNVCNKVLPYMLNPKYKKRLQILKRELEKQLVYRRSGRRVVGRPTVIK